MMMKLLARWLVTPSPDVVEPDQRRQAALLSGFLLVLSFIAIVIEATTDFLIDWANYTGYRQTLAGVVCLMIVYRISRTRHVQLAATLTVGVIVAGVFVTGLAEPRGVLGGLLDYLILPLWLGSLYIDLRKLALLIVVTIIGLLVFPLLSPTVTLNTILIGPFSFLLITSVILLVITYYRNRLEQDRRAELSSMFVRVQRTNEELSQAYETTIEGWSLALDLRDKETEGHSRRVTDMTLMLARSCGFSDAELLHIRRGALLHDIGKMGVPDLILLKNGPLTPDEWAIMRRHPVYAYEMLLPIHYLRQALDIPYCHHEKWDGSGYPRGLRGEQIPLAARIFALVDVWDALTSDRPYRKAWPKEKALAYMREQVGTHFDPDLVEPFLRMLDSA
jgi:hypothetical protein